MKRDSWLMRAYVCVMCMIRLLFFLCSLPRLGGFFVCLCVCLPVSDTGFGTIFTSDDRGIVYSKSLDRHLYTTTGGETDFTNVTSLRGVYMTSVLSEGGSFSWICSERRLWGTWSCPLSNGACLANKPVCEFWLSVLSKLWWLELRKNKATAGIKKDLRLFCLWKKSYVLGSSGLWEGVWTTLLLWLSRMEQ